MADYPSMNQLSDARTDMACATTSWQVYPSTVDGRTAFAKNAVDVPPGRARFNLAEGTAHLTSVGLDATGKVFMAVTYHSRQLELCLRLSKEIAQELAAALIKASK